MATVVTVDITEILGFSLDDGHVRKALVNPATCLVILHSHIVRFIHILYIRREVDVGEKRRHSQENQTPRDAELTMANLSGKQPP